MAASSQSEPAVDGIVEQGEGGGEVPEDGTVTPPPRSRGLDEEITALIQRRKDLRRERAVVAKAVRKAGADRSSNRTYAIQLYNN
jgi:hypothetical protein